MRRKLLILNVVLVALIVVTGYRLRQEWLDARARERAVMNKRIKPIPPPPHTQLPNAQPVVPANYIDIADKMLFSKDRNPTVVVPATPQAAPKPMPPLPVLHGIMNLGDGPSAILSETPGAPHRDYRPGQNVGEFKLVAVSNQEIVFQWEGKEVRRKVDELLDRSETNETAKNTSPPAAQPAKPAPPPPPSGRAEPGADLGNGVRACQPGDTSPAGTVMNGMRKVVTPTPFGQACRWEPIG